MRMCIHIDGSCYLGYIGQSFTIPFSCRIKWKL